MVCQKIWAASMILSYLPPNMKSVGNHGSSSMLSMMKGMVWHYVSDAHKVKTALILVRLVFFC